MHRHRCRRLGSELSLSGYSANDPPASTPTTVTTLQASTDIYQSQSVCNTPPLATIDSIGGTPIVQLSSSTEINRKLSLDDSLASLINNNNNNVLSSSSNSMTTENQFSSTLLPAFQSMPGFDDFPFSQQHTGRFVIVVVFSRAIFEVLLSLFFFLADSQLNCFDYDYDEPDDLPLDEEDWRHPVKKHRKN